MRAGRVVDITRKDLLIIFSRVRVYNLLPKIKFYIFTSGGYPMKCQYINCDVVFDDTVPGKKYCCRNHKLYAHLQKMRAIPKVQIVCGVCGVEFLGRNDRKYCSKSCGTASRKASVLGSVKHNQKLYTQWLREYKDKLVCTDCGISGHGQTEIIDFHHVGPKRFTLASTTASNLWKKGTGLKTIMSEIDNCIPLCANCHRKRHAHRP